MKMVRVTLVLNVISGTAIAEGDDDQTHSQLDFGADLNVKLIHSDNGFEDEADREATSEMDSLLLLHFDKAVAPDTYFHSYINATSTGEQFLDAVEVAKMTKAFHSTFSLALGRDYLNVGGFENAFLRTQEDSISAYGRYRLPFHDVAPSRSAPTVALSATAGIVGQFTLQLTNDVLSGDESPDNQDLGWQYHNRRRKQPVGLLEWRGSYDRWTPMVQVSSYDLNHSLYLSASLQTKASIFDAYVDYITDKRSYNGQEEAENSHVRYTSVVAKVTVELGSFYPSLKYSRMKASQSEIDGVGNASIDSFDDNSESIAAGFDWKESSALSPYLLYERATQAVNDNPRDPFSVETVTEVQTTIGIRGKI